MFWGAMLASKSFQKTIENKVGKNLKQNVGKKSTGHRRMRGGIRWSLKRSKDQRIKESEGTRYQIPATWHQLIGSKKKLPLPGTRYLVLGTWALGPPRCRVSGTRYRYIHGNRYQVLVPWALSGPWSRVAWGPGS